MTEETPLQYHFLQIHTGHLRIYWYKAIGTINPFKQSKRALELKLSNFKLQVFHLLARDTMIVVTYNMS